ncbi:MAG: hypothetical protein K2X37_08110 [Chitinophagaceae bacterium]|nr:hypothetical protein [Chitinophagaceae bacterium]
MKWVLYIFLIGICSCKQHKADFLPAETGLDAGREFIDGCLKGDFIKARYYMVTNDINEALLNSTEASYREADKEGRQQLRTASINIKELKEVNDSTVALHYSNTLDTTSKWLYIIKQENIWKVDYKKSFQ